jgi:hypothetical protein
MKALVTLLATIAAVFLLTDAGSAYRASGRRWAAGTVTMHLQQGSTSGSLIDGSRDWNTVTEGALATWNSYLNGLSFRVQRDSTSANSGGNGINNVVWGDDVYGDPFGDSTLAITLSRYRVSDNRFVETDVVFNTKFSWNSYRGNTRRADGGGNLIDIRRVALHEFGHALGLDHPDDHGQSVSAIMNSRIGNTDSLQSDDTNGVQSIYGSVTTAAPAATDTLSSGARLSVGQTLVSANRRYRLLMQSDGNLVLYDDVDRTAPWASNTGGISAGHALLQGDGNFVVYDAQGIGRFASNTTGYPNSRLLLQNDGNLVLYNASGQPTWDRSR